MASDADLVLVPIDPTGRYANLTDRWATGPDRSYWPESLAQVLPQPVRSGHRADTSLRSKLCGCGENRIKRHARECHACRQNRLLKPAR
jgi:hypothetical protein